MLLHRTFLRQLYLKDKCSLIVNEYIESMSYTCYYLMSKMNSMAMLYDVES